MRFLDDGDYASENAASNIVNWHKETEEGGIWLDMGDVHETRKFHMHPWIHRESSEYESDASDASDRGTREVFDRAKVQRWLEDISADPCEDSDMPATAKRKREMRVIQRTELMNLEHNSNIDEWVKSCTTA